MSFDPTKKTVALAGAGDVAKYFAEELLSTKNYNILIISRALRPWFSNNPSLTLATTDYSTSSLLAILNQHKVSTLFSFIHDNSSFYTTVHMSMLSACQQSSHCKRFVPSEYGGNLERADFAGMPRFYRPTHGVFREVLRKQSDVEWTLLNIGWFMDYVVPVEQSYMKSIVPVWPVDLKLWKAVVPGSGEEPIGLTAARDVARAGVQLVDAEKWDEHTYVCGENTTWNALIKTLEEHYGRKIEVSYNPREDIETALSVHAEDEDKSLLWKAFMDEWNVTGASAMPWDLVVDQRERFFSGVHFRTVKELLVEGSEKGKI